MDNFEYDIEKSQANKVKHSLDFEQAKLLWDDAYVIELSSKQTQGKDRFLLLGKIKHRHYTAIITYRGTNIRIISVRSSRKNEVKFYESNRFRQEV
ncbi:COGs COG2929 [uncultured Candidatus Thioglobus sp.]|nr:COGs COG2929 [uncultured Candidatus Thioglobus sp.]